MSKSLWPHELQHAITISQSLLKFMSVKSVLSNHLILCHPLLLLLSIFPSIRVFSNELVLIIRCSKYWSFTFNISPSNEYSGLISLRLTGLISLLSKRLSRVFSSTTIQQCQFFRAQTSLRPNSHIHTGLPEKSIALTRGTFVGKVMSLLFNMLSRFVTAFLPRSKHLFISWLQSLSTMILRPKKIKSVTVSVFFPLLFAHEVIGPNAMILDFWMLSFKPAFSLSCFMNLIKRLFSSSSLSAIKWTSQ